MKEFEDTLSTLPEGTRASFNRQPKAYATPALPHGRRVRLRL